MDKFQIFFVIMIILIIIWMFYILCYYSFDNNSIQTKFKNTLQKLYNGPLQSLLNGSGINNIPNINIISTNPQVQQANNCAKGPVFINSEFKIDNLDCIRICVNDSAKAIKVEEEESIAFDNSFLSPGSYCIIGPRPECNTNTTIVLMTINSVTCRSKFPELVGGKVGNTIVACNNSIINDPKNILWDNKNNKPFNTYTTKLTNVDELLEDSSSFRFTCKFNGTDNLGNKYIESPLNRFHPMKNYCTQTIYKAHPDIKFVLQGDNFICDCGNYEITRVKNINENDKSSICSNVSYTITDSDKKDEKILTVPYNCFNLFSTLDDVGNKFPCPGDQFTRQGSQIAEVQIHFTENPNALIENPIYEFLSNKGFEVLDNYYIV